MKRALISLLLAAALLLGGCGAMAPSDYTKSADLAVDEANEVGDTSLSFSDGSGTVSDGRKLIKTLTLHMETENFDALAAEVSRCVAEYGGYVEQSEISGASRRSASYTLRIPVARLEEFTSDVTAAGVVTRRSSTQEDVTLDYVDMEAHITALNTERDTLLRLLEQAESMEDVITIQDRITQVQYELESYTSRLRTYDNQIIYLPNSQITAGSIVNVTSEDVRRVDISVSASYDDAADKVRAALCAAAAAHEKTLRDRPVEAHVVSYGDSSIQYVLRFWARTEDYWTCYNDVLDGMQEVFSAAGITMCYPHINVHMGS